MRYKNLQYWDGIGDSLQDGDICVEDGRFVDETRAESRDLSGCFAIPGLIDAHIHLCLNPEVRDPDDQTLPGREQLLDEMRGRAETMLRAGITAARDLGGGQYLELQVRDEIARGDVAGPRLICAGQPITSRGGHCHFWGGEADSTGQALEVLQRQDARGVDLIKIMVTGGNITPGSAPKDSQFDDDTVCEVVRAANARGYHVAAHCHGTDGIRQAADAGVTTVEHCSWVGESGWGKQFDEGVVARLAENQVWVSPTINSGWKRFKQEAFVQMVGGNYERMKAAGVRLIASTDAGIPNVFHHDLPVALPVFASFAGLSQLEVLKSATSDCASAIGLGEVTGAIRPGLSADFVVYEKNPLEDLAALENPIMVVSRGIATEITR
ncbi:MAG: amidohydrolase family protein [Pseudomonadales bacterium]|nr:amidohydrolase family protein [Pseudomonadales bacterium]